MSGSALASDRFRADVVRAADSEAVAATTDECVLDILRWDFHWQQAYRLPVDDHVTLEDGDAVRVTCVHDNSEGASDVTWGGGTSDEMCILYYASLRPYTPTLAPSATPCAPTTNCVAACGDAPSLDCVFSCTSVDIRCSLCALREGLRRSTAAEAPCLGELLAAQGCRGTCLGTHVMLGSNPGGSATHRRRSEPCVKPVFGSTYTSPRW